MCPKWGCLRAQEGLESAAAYFSLPSSLPAMEISSQEDSGVNPCEDLCPQQQSSSDLKCLGSGSREYPWLPAAPCRRGAPYDFADLIPFIPLTLLRRAGSILFGRLFTYSAGQSSLCPLIKSNLLSAFTTSKFLPQLPYFLPPCSALRWFQCHSVQRILSLW